MRFCFSGKGNEDKRGQPISQAMQDRIWLYLSGCPVLCTRQMEAVAIISSINPAISSTVDSVEMGVLQQVCHQNIITSTFVFVSVNQICKNIYYY